MHLVERDYLELGPRVAGLLLAGFTWGSTPDVDWHIDAVPTEGKVIELDV